MSCKSSGKRAVVVQPWGDTVVYNSDLDMMGYNWSGIDLDMRLLLA